MDISELKGEAKTWNLASDSKLLEYLQQFSSGVTDRTKSFAEKVDELTFDVADSEVSLKNTFNDFLMLGNSQFIENRVYDDDEEEEEEVVVESENNTLSDPFPNLKEAFSLGQEALKLFFVEDSPDEKFEDIYNVRPLPYIIGTKSYVDSADAGLGGIGIFEEDHIGSGDTAPTDKRAYSVDERSEVSDRFEHHPPAAVYTQSEDGDSHAEDRQLQGAGHEQDDSTIQSGETDSFAVPPPRAMPRPTGNPLKDMLNAQIVNRGSSAGAPSASAGAWDEEEDEDNVAAAPQKSLAAVLGGRMGQPQQSVQSDDHSVASKSSAGASVAVAGRAGQNHYDQQEEEEEDGDLFSAANDDPFGLFGSSKPSAFTRKATTKNSLGDLFGTASSLGDDDSESDNSSLFGSSAALSSSAKSSSNAVPKRKASFSSLFGDANDDSLFDEIAPTKATSAPSPVPVAPKLATEAYDAHDLFSKTDAGDTAFAAVEAPKAEENKKKPGVRALGASDLFGGGGLFGDDDDAGGLFGVGAASKSGSAKSTAPTSTSTTKAKFSSLFGDDDTSSLFGGSAAGKPAQAAVVVAVKKKKSIFDDEDEEEGGLFGLTSKPAAPVSATASKPAPIVSALVEAEKEDEDDVRKVSPADTIVAPEAAHSIAASIPAPEKPAAAKKSIFDDDSDDEDSLFTSSKPGTSKTSTAAVIKPTAAPATKSTKMASLFDDDSGDDGLFSKPKAAGASSVAAPAGTSKPLAKRSVFDDDSDGDADLFAPKPTPTVTTPAPTAVILSAPPSPPTPTPTPELTTQVVEEEQGDVPPPPPRPTGGVSIPLPPCRQPVPGSDSEEEEDDDNDDSVSASNRPVSATAVQEPVASVAPAAASTAPSGVRMGVALPMPFHRPPAQEDTDEDSVEEDEPASAPTLAPVLPVLTPVLEPTATVVVPVSDVEPAAAVVPAPAEASPVAVSNKRLSGGLASIVAGMDASKIMMPGMSPPPRASALPTSTEADSPSSGSSHRAGSEGVNSVSADGTLASAAMSRATNSRQKRAPSKKTFTVSADTSLLAVPTTAPLTSSAGPKQDEEGVSVSAPVIPASKSSRSADLFGDGSDGGGDPFGVKPASKPTTAVADAPTVATLAPAFSAKKADLFGEEAPTGILFGDKTAAITTTAAGIAKPAATSSAKSSLFGDDIDEDGLFGSSSPKKSPSPAPAATVPAAVTTTAARGGLFGDDDGDSLFAPTKPSSSSGTASSSKPATAAVPPARKDSKPSAKGGLFGDDDDGLFGDDTSTLFGSSGTKKAISSTTTAASTAAKRSSLFGDDDDPLFGGASAGAKKTTMKKGLFDD